MTLKTLWTPLLLLLLGGCRGQELTDAVPEVLATYPHDSSAFTQGLVLEGSRFYESTGLYGESTLREVVPETGEVLREVTVPREYFAEGLALVDDRLLLTLWHLAERWGRVTPTGIVVPLPLGHQRLADLVGAHRPSVTTALGELARAGSISRRDDGNWLLHGAPPEQLRRRAGR